MAKWGEGDPRWIVEERPDATNVNNWHWAEKNADTWSKSKLKELFVDFVIEDSKIGNVIIEEMEKCEGEARANNRKAKLIFFYEWEILLKWKGHVNGNDKEVTGKIEIPNLSEEHDDMNDVDLIITVTTGQGKEADVLKEMLRKGPGSKIIREKLQNYVDALKKEYSSNLILPGKNEAKPVDTQAKQAIVTSTKVIVNNSSTSKTNSDQLQSLNLGGKIEVGDLDLEETFKCTGMEIFNALTQPEMIQVFTRGEVKMASEAKNDMTFSYLGGNIEGKYTEVTPYTQIGQKWRLKSWPQNHFSEVTISIKQTKDDTKLSIKQKKVPIREMENTRQGWHRYYFQAIKQSFGFGASLF